MSAPLDVARRMLALPEGASSFADGVDLLHLAVISATMLGAVAVALVTAWRLLRSRRESDTQATPRTVSGPLLMVVKIGGPATLFVAFWIVGFAQYREMQTSPAGAMDVYVTAKQWMWKFAYPNGVTTIGTLTVPVGRPVRLVMTSRDVIHSFYVPAFRVKHDVVPGAVNVLWFTATKPGSYDVFCAEYCGASHSGMLGKVVALEEHAFGQWLQRQPPEGNEGGVAAYGAEVARKKQCLACHSIDGQRHIGPSFRGLFMSNVPLEDGRTVVADGAYLTRSMMDPAREVHAGFKPVMPTYRGLLDAGEVAALVAWISSLRDAPVTETAKLPEITP